MTAGLRVVYDESMEIRYLDAELARLETDARFAAEYGTSVVRGFRKVVAFIRAASDERDLYAMKSLHFEKMEGNKKNQRSLRLNKQWRLFVRIETEGGRKVVTVIAIDDPH